MQCPLAAPEVTYDSTAFNNRVYHAFVLQLTKPARFVRQQSQKHTFSLQKRPSKTSGAEYSSVPGVKPLLLLAMTRDKPTSVIFAMV